MKLYRNLVEAVAITLSEIFDDGRQADRAIERTLKSDKRWGSRDRAFIAETCYEIVRYWRYLVTILGQESPDYYHIIGVHLKLKGIELPDTWPEFAKILSFDVIQNAEKYKKNRPVVESIPDWLDNIGEAQLGKKWSSELHALNQPADVFLRVNTLKTDRHELRGLLKKDNIETEILDNLPDALRLIQKSNVFKTEPFQKGLFEVQDAASQMVAQFLDAQPGMRVIDACAGAGGKTLHLAALMQNKGQIVAMDTEGWKLEELRRRARRNGAFNIETREIETKTIKRLRDSADRLLLDVPCSGLGVLRRNPDTKWKLQPEFLEQIQKTQYEILSKYAQMVKANGKMVYATCSILPSESEKQVERFLEEQQDAWQLLAERRVSPAIDGYDGFYMALLQKT